MMTNLYEKGYVRNIPGAPMCGCIEQMPVVDNTACVKPIESWTIDNNGTIGVNLSWEDCGRNLAKYYKTLKGKATWEKNFVNERIVRTGKYPAATRHFMNERFLVPDN